jgi:hypothetical protein
VAPALWGPKAARCQGDGAGHAEHQPRGAVVQHVRAGEAAAPKDENENGNFRLPGIVFEILPRFWFTETKSATKNTETKTVFSSGDKNENDFSLFRPFLRTTVFSRYFTTGTTE